MLLNVYIAKYLSISSFFFWFCFIHHALCTYHIVAWNETSQFAVVRLLACEVSGISLFVLNACLLILLHTLEGESRGVFAGGLWPNIWCRCTFCAKRTSERLRVELRLTWAQVIFLINKWPKMGVWRRREKKQRKKGNLFWFVWFCGRLILGSISLRERRKKKVQVITPMNEEPQVKQGNHTSVVFLNHLQFDKL